MNDRLKSSAASLIQTWLTSEEVPEDLAKGLQGLAAQLETELSPLAQYLLNLQRLKALRSAPSWEPQHDQVLLNHLCTLRTLLTVEECVIVNTAWETVPERPVRAGACERCAELDKVYARLMRASGAATRKDALSTALLALDRWRRLKERLGAIEVDWDLMVEGLLKLSNMRLDRLVSMLRELRNGQG